MIGGRLGDRIGRRRTFAIGATAFMLTSLACGLEPSIEWLLVLRAAQGMAAGIIVPQILATIHVTTTGRQNSTALAWYGAIGGVGFVLGQILGGVLVSADIAGLGWRWARLPVGPPGAGVPSSLRSCPVLRLPGCSCAAIAWERCPHPAHVAPHPEPATGPDHRHLVLRLLG